jgi:hypothetical protein
LKILKRQTEDEVGRLKRKDIKKKREKEKI